MSHADAVTQVWEDAQSLSAPGRLPVEHSDIETQSDTLVDGKAGMKPSYDSTTCTRINNVPLVECTEDKDCVNNHKTQRLSPWWDRFLGLWICDCAADGVDRADWRVSCMAWVVKSKVQQPLLLSANFVNILGSKPLYGIGRFSNFFQKNIQNLIR